VACPRPCVLTISVIHERAGGIIAAAVVIFHRL
jgi:hypothetical protein